jgi:hypothetical protein
MKKVVVLGICGLLACGPTKKPVKEADFEGRTTVDSISRNRIDSSSEARVAKQGDFDGNGQQEKAICVQTKEAQGNPVEDGIAAAYEVRFSDSVIPAIDVRCCEVRLINEGDLNGDGRDDLSVFQAPYNGRTYSFTTYSLQKGEWKAIVAPFLIPLVDKEPNDEELQQRVFLEKGEMYILGIDVNDINFRLIKKKASRK